MAAQAQIALGVARQVLDIIRVIAGRAVAVFAFDLAVRRAAECPDILPVTLCARVVAFIRDRELLPFLDVAQAMKVVGEAGAVHTEIIWNKKSSRNKNKCYESDCDPQGMQYVSLH